ncbi:MAG: alpha/beta hydrolase [Solirubrobacterales bacterium]|nr:alpha/beta hydrolase [Solirubrobacterales bacterium]
MIGTSHILEVPCGRLAYDDTGDGPLVIAAPGLGDLRRQFRFLGNDLMAAGLRVVTVDLRGHGGSSTGFHDVTKSAVADDLLALVRHLDAGPAVLAGSSYAGGAAVVAAARAPDLVAGLVLLGAFVRDLPLDPKAPWRWGSCDVRWAAASGAATTGRCTRAALRPISTSTSSSCRRTSPSPAAGQRSPRCSAPTTAPRTRSSAMSGRPRSSSWVNATPTFATPPTRRGTPPTGWAGTPRCCSFPGRGTTRMCRSRRSCPRRSSASRRACAACRPEPERAR